LRAPRGSGHRGRRPRRGTAGLAAGWGVGWVLSSPMPTEPVQVLLISGPGGVGKSTLGWEVATQLRRLGIAHVLLDSVELDRAWPLTTAERDQLDRANLTAFWANAAALGHTRLVFVGV